MANEYGNDFVVLTDEDGREIEFEVLGSIEYDGLTYVGLIEQFDDPAAQLESDGRMIVLKAIEDDNGEELLVTIDDEELANVLPAFEEALGEEYDIDGEE
ncbi:MAG: DUF1292 domain-containing protein [Clostridia bacterium]|nr:DUF1292 domain-containing protein [Clostridia bacterium]